VQQTGDVVPEVDEDAELGEAVDGPAVVPTGREILRIVALEIPPDVLLVCNPLGHTGRTGRCLKRLSKAIRHRKRITDAADPRVCGSA